MKANDQVAELYVGGLIGSERYGDIKDCAVQGDVKVTNSKVAQIGGVVGEFSKTYGAIGGAFGILKTSVSHCYVSGKVTIDNVNKPVLGAISGSGQPEPLMSWFGQGMSYVLSDCGYLASGMEVVDHGISSLRSFENVNHMKGESMSNLLGKQQWLYTTDALPTPLVKE